jgi:putative Mn2+ efflux pump MntP
MSQLDLLLIALGLAMDAFAVSLGAAAAGRAQGGRAAFRLAFHFGLFQFMMPVIGWFAGRLVASLIASIDHWVAFFLLLFVGLRMVSASRHGQPSSQLDPSRGWTLVMLAIATSIDALAVGISLAMLAVDIWYASAVIGLVAAALSLAGVRLGTLLQASFGRWVELAGGILLIAIGARILLSHLLGWQGV